MIHALGAVYLASAAATGEAGFADPANRTLLASTAVVVAVVVLLAWVARRRSGLVPTGLGAVVEHLYDWVDEMARDMMGPQGRRYVPFAMSIFLFVLASNWSGLLPVPKFAEAGAPPVALHSQESGEQVVGHPLFEAPSVSFNTTLALAVVSFLSFNFYGLRKNLEVHPGSVHGSHRRGGIAGFVKWLSHFWEPTPMLWRDLSGAMRYLLVPLLACLFIVLNVVEEFARLISLSIRLYGNIFGEHEVKTQLTSTLSGFLGQSESAFQAGSVGGGAGYGMMSLLLWGSSFFVLCVGALAGFIQAFIFFVLTLSYISHVVAEDH